MKRLIIATILLISSTAFAAGGLMEKDGNKEVIQGFAPNGLLSQLLTVNSVTYDMTGNAAWCLYAPSSGCKVRVTPTSAKSVYPQHTVADSQYVIRVINKKTGFINFSGCTNAELQRQ